MRCGCRLCFTEARLRSACDIGDAGATALAGALEKNTVLRSLNLAGQYVVIAIFLKCWKLWCLYFLLFVKVWFWWRDVRCGCRLCFTEARLRSACIKIGDAGATALAGALEKNTVLQQLNFGREIVARNVEVLFFLLILFAVVPLVCFFVCAHSIVSDCS